jgi:regulatory protein
MDYAKAKAYALRRLGAKSQHSLELASAMAGKGVEEALVVQIIDELTQAGYVNDRAWLEAFVKHQQLRKHGPRMIIQKLQAKGISSQAAKQAVEEFGQSEMQEEAIQRLLETRYRSKDLTNHLERQKVFAALIRKGFSVNQIQKALNVE